MVFFYKRVLGKLWDDNLVPRAINDYAIPRVLTRSEIEMLLDATSNLKYKAIFALMYSSGLRISEVIHLRYEDISRTNMQIYIHESKTHTARYAIYLKELLIFLRNTGLNVADQQEFFSLISGLVIISHLPVLAWN